MPSDQKAPLRRLLLERRDCTSGDLLDIAAKKIQRRLHQIPPYKDAAKLGLYHSIGSEIPTHDIIQDLLSSGRQVFLPKVLGSSLEFRRIEDPADLQSGSFGIMEPKDRCMPADSLDVVLVPAVGMSPKGQRLGYGRGFYDRFLQHASTVAISPILGKQVVRTIPQSDNDGTIDWVITEDRIYEASRA